MFMRLIANMATRKMVTKMDLGIAGFQYPIESVPAIISRGRVIVHCRA